MTRAWTALLLLPLGCISGCSVSELPELGPLPEGPPEAAIAVAPPRLEFVPSPQRSGQTPRTSSCLACDECRARVAASTVARAEDEEPRCTACGEGELEDVVVRWLAAPDVAAVATRTAALLAERGGFTAATPLAEPPGDLQGEPREEALRAAAREAGARWLLEPVLEAAETTYEGQNALLPFKLFNLVSLTILVAPGFDPPNWFLPSEHYGLWLLGRWRLIDLQADGPAAEGELQARAERVFADFGMGLFGGRGWFFGGFLRVPECLDDEDWQDIARQLQPEAEECLARQLVLAAEGARRPHPAAQ